MVCVIAFGVLHPNHEIVTLMISLPGMLVLAEIAGNGAKIFLFSLRFFLTIVEYQYSSDGNFTAVLLFA